MKLVEPVVPGQGETDTFRFPPELSHPSTTPLSKVELKLTVELPYVHVKKLMSAGLPWEARTAALVEPIVNVKPVGAGVGAAVAVATGVSIGTGIRVGVLVGVGSVVGTAVGVGVTGGPTTTRIVIDFRDPVSPTTVIVTR